MFVNLSPSYIITQIKVFEVTKVRVMFYRYFFFIQLLTISPTCYVENFTKPLPHSRRVNICKQSTLSSTFIGYIVITQYLSN